MGILSRAGILSPSIVQRIRRRPQQTIAVANVAESCSGVGMAGPVLQVNDVAATLAGRGDRRHTHGMDCDGRIEGPASARNAPSIIPPPGETSAECGTYRGRAREPSTRAGIADLLNRLTRLTKRRDVRPLPQAVARAAPFHLFLEPPGFDERPSFCNLVCAAERVRQRDAGGRFQIRCI